MSEESALDLNKEEDIIMENIREEHCRDGAEEGDDKNEVNAPRCWV